MTWKSAINQYWSGGFSMTSSIKDRGLALQPRKIAVATRRTMRFASERIIKPTKDGHPFTAEANVDLGYELGEYHKPYPNPGDRLDFPEAHIRDGMEHTSSLHKQR